MKIVIADTGALISLGLVGKIQLIENVFGEFYIAEAVWDELRNYENPDFDSTTLQMLQNHIVKIKSPNYLSLVMDYGESESVILYNEVQADYLLIDDSKARTIAETLGVRCIGSIGLLIRAKQMGLLNALKPIFAYWLKNGRYFSKSLLNTVLTKIGEGSIRG